MYRTNGEMGKYQQSFSVIPKFTARVELQEAMEVQTQKVDVLLGFMLAESPKRWSWRDRDGNEEEQEMKEQRGREL